MHAPRCLSGSESNTIWNEIETVGRAAGCQCARHTLGGTALPTKLFRVPRISSSAEKCPHLFFSTQSKAAEDTIVPYWPLPRPRKAVLTSRFIVSFIHVCLHVLHVHTSCRISPGQLAASIPVFVAHWILCCNCVAVLGERELQGLKWGARGKGCREGI